MSDYLYLPKLLNLLFLLNNYFKQLFFILSELAIINKIYSMDHQIAGGHHDSVYSKNCSSLEESLRTYQKMKEVYFDINLWNQLFNGQSKFTVTDSAGKSKSGMINTGDFVAIKIPGPKNRIGQGYDWVQVISVEMHEAFGISSLCIALQPAKNPVSKNSKYTAHFFKTMAKNYFIIKKEGTEITAEVHGRNEIPNCSGVPLRDRIRNFFIANGGIFGMSKIQWEVWSKNILNEKYLQKCLKNSK